VDGALHTEVSALQRALLPGPAGAELDPQRAFPFHEDLTVGIYGLDSPLGVDSVDARLTAWGVLDSADHRTVDGEVTEANVTQRLLLGKSYPARLILGRQVLVSGAARFARFDGAFADVRTPSGLGVATWGGMSVLPHWDGLTNYRFLGSSLDAMASDPTLYRNDSRAGSWMLGGRVFYERAWLQGGLSFHQEMDRGDVARRDGGVDLILLPGSLVDIRGRAILDLGYGALSDALLAVDYFPVTPLRVAGVYRHSEPARLLSHVSVLSVFATDNVDELGGEFEWKASRAVTLTHGSFAALHAGAATGSRHNATVRVLPDPQRRLLVVLGYGRVHESENGYHHLQGSLRYLEP